MVNYIVTVLSAKYYQLRKFTSQPSSLEIIESIIYLLLCTFELQDNLHHWKLSNQLFILLLYTCNLHSQFYFIPLMQQIIAIIISIAKNH